MRNIDATRFDEAIGLVLHQHLTGTTTVLRWQARTRDGSGEARTFLAGLNEHRNRIAHIGRCNQATKAVCLLFERLIDSLKAFFQAKKVERTFNVPTFVRIEETSFTLMPSRMAKGNS
jgi:hypothetical protein